MNKIKTLSITVDTGFLNHEVSLLVEQIIVTLDMHHVNYEIREYMNDVEDPVPIVSKRYGRNRWV